MTTLYKCLRCETHHHISCPVCFCTEHLVIGKLDLAPLGIVGDLQVLAGNKHFTLIIDLHSCTKKITLDKEDIIPNST